MIKWIDINKEKPPTMLGVMLKINGKSKRGYRTGKNSYSILPENEGHLVTEWHYIKEKL